MEDIKIRDYLSSELKNASVSKILIDISAKKIWQKEEINLVRNVLFSCYASLSLKEYLELSVRLTDDKEIMDLNKTYRNKTVSYTHLTLPTNREV